MTRTWHWIFNMVHVQGSKSYFPYFQIVMFISMQFVVVAVVKENSKCTTFLWNILYKITQIWLHVQYCMCFLSGLVLVLFLRARKSMKVSRRWRIWEELGKRNEQDHLHEILKNKNLKKHTCELLKLHSHSKVSTIFI